MIMKPFGNGLPRRTSNFIMFFKNKNTLAEKIFKVRLQQFLYIGFFSMFVYEITKLCQIAVGSFFFVDLFQDFIRSQLQPMFQFLKSGEVVGALYKLSQEQQDGGMPPCWSIYMTVPDAAAAAAKGPKRRSGSVPTSSAKKSSKTTKTAAKSRKRKAASPAKSAAAAKRKASK